MGAVRRTFTLLALPLALASAGCEGRFPTCNSSADCAARDAGATAPVCYNLKCVECRYDTDCDAGACNSANACEALVTRSKGDPPDAGVGKDEGWEYGSWDQCAADCKEPQCIKLCDQKFQK